MWDEVCPHQSRLPWLKQGSSWFNVGNLYPSPALVPNPISVVCRLEEMEGTLLVLKDKYGVNVCGEGGEYETFTLDSPLFRKVYIPKVYSLK